MVDSEPHAKPHELPSAEKIETHITKLRSELLALESKSPPDKDGDHITAVKVQLIAAREETYAACSQWIDHLEFLEKDESQGGFSGAKIHARQQLRDFLRLHGSFEYHTLATLTDYIPTAFTDSLLVFTEVLAYLTHDLKRLTTRATQTHRTPEEIPVEMARQKIFQQRLIVLKRLRQRCRQLEFDKKQPGDTRKAAKVWEELDRLRNTEIQKRSGQSDSLQKAHEALTRQLVHCRLRIYDTKALEPEEKALSAAWQRGFSEDTELQLELAALAIE